MSKDNKTSDNNDSANTQALRRHSQDRQRKTCAVGLPKTKKALLNLYHVNKSIAITNDPNECYFGGAPTLWNANLCYGNGTSEEWLIYQLTDLSEFTGVSKKITAPQISQMAQLIVGDYGYLKITEVMLFFRRFKIGRYGTFYGNVDPLVIMNSFDKFLVERNDTIDAYYSELEIRKANADIGNEKCVSYQDYLKHYKNNNKNG